MPQTASKDLASIEDLELSNALQNPAHVAPFSHIGTAQLQELSQLSEIYSAALSSSTTHHTPPVYQASSQFRSTVSPAHVPVLPPPFRIHPPQQRNPVTTPCPVSILEGEPQTGAISKGGTYN
jgi:hypothetical protein